MDYRVRGNDGRDDVGGEGRVSNPPLRVPVGRGLFSEEAATKICVERSLGDHKGRPYDRYADRQGPRGSRLRRFGGELGLGGLGDGGEGLGVGGAELGEHLAVDVDAGELEAVDELAV